MAYLTAMLFRYRSAKSYYLARSTTSKAAFSSPWASRIFPL